ncbi:MAG: class I SAM-dependent methyltransferase [Polyangiales bacterium]
MSGIAALYPNIPVHSYDGTHFPFPDQSFDLAHSNAVIEHVGEREDQRRFLAEMYRAALGGMVVTPNKYFRSKLIHSCLACIGATSSAFDGGSRVSAPQFARGFRRIGRHVPPDELPQLRLLSRSDLCMLAREAGIRHSRSEAMHCSVGRSP